MGNDIYVYVEKRKSNSCWEMCMPEEYIERHEWGQHCNPFDVGGRCSNLFQILSGIYDDKIYGDDFKIIAKGKGIPKDISEEVAFYMEYLIGCSWLSLKEILHFDWDFKHDAYGVYREIIPMQFFDMVKFLQSNLSNDTTEEDIRIVFGYSG